MSDLLLGAFGEQLLELIQNFSNPFLDLYFGVVTTLGGTLSVLIIVVLLYYTINKEFTSKLIYFLLCSVYLSRVTKIIFHNPRPYQFDSKFQITTNVGRETVWSESGYSFPSEHAQTQGTVWSYIFSRYRPFPILIIGIIFLISIPLSRSYLGVHWLSDVIMGLVFGVFLSFLFFQIDRRYGIHVDQLKDSQKIILGFCLSFALLILGIVAFIIGTIFPFNEIITFSDPSVWENAALGNYPGILGGFIVGQTLELKYIKFQIKKRELKSKFLRIIIGMISVIVLYLFSKAIEDLFEEIQRTSIYWITTLLNFLSFFLLAFVLSFIIPWLFVRIEEKLFMK